MIPPLSFSRNVYCPAPTSSFCDVVGEHLVKPGAGVASRRDQLTHVRNIEDADVVSHRLVFIHDARCIAPA